MIPTQANAPESPEWGPGKRRSASRRRERARPAPGTAERIARARSQSESELAYITTDDLRPAALVAALIYVVMAVYNAVSYPPGVRGPMCTYDIALIVLGLGLARLCGRVRLSSQGVHLAAAVLSFAILGNVLYAALLGVSPLFSFYVAVLMIGSAGCVLAPVWGAAIAVVEVTAWAIVARAVLSGSELTLHAMVMVASAGVAVVVHMTRWRARSRILELRAGDVRRELRLQRALAEADEARRGLDRKVEERTAELRGELEQRERLEEQLRHSQKMEAIGRLAGGIAHDFNNLLTVIRLSLLTIAEVELPGEARDAHRDASEATDRAAVLTHDLLAFARKQTLARTPVAVSDILGGVERMVRRVVEAGIRTDLRVADDTGEVVADRHQLEQVFLNLAINGCDAMGRRGTLSMRADAVELQGEDAARHRVTPGSYVRISVIDTGTGMDEATMRSAFEPFFTTKEVGRGTGLGLAVAHGIVTQHGGQIEIESALGKGSTFTVFLPRGGSGVTRIAAAAKRPVASMRGETVLVVEDEPAVRRAVQRNLERLGYHVLVAHDGEDALRFENTAGIDLLLSDVVMPGIDGPELAHRLRARWPELPVLFATGYSADRLARSGALGPHDRVIEKPYQLEELARTIRQMLEVRASQAVVALPAERDS